MDKLSALQKLLNGSATEEEIQLLKQALASGEISIGGNITDSNVINGSDNISVTNKEGTINIFVAADKTSMIRELMENKGFASLDREQSDNGEAGKSKTEQILETVRTYRSFIAAEIEFAAVRSDWSMNSFIKEEARFLPVNASPYRPDSFRGEPIDLIYQLNKNKSTIVLGEPGSGKSVALERFAWVLASNESLEVPFLFRLAELHGDSLLQQIRVELSKINLISIATVPIEYSNSPLKDVHIYILLDGLNEVQGDESQRLVKEILQIKNQFPKVNLVVTSRIQDEGWRGLQSIWFETLVIQPLRLEDARTYLENQLGTDKAFSLWESLDTNLREIIRTPLILRLVKELAYRQEKDVKMPRNRGELYEEFVRTRFFIDRIGSAQARQMWQDLERLALFMQLQTVNKLNIDEERLFEVLKDDQKIQTVRASGFIIGEGRGIKFSHQTFQEFFVARAIRHTSIEYLKYSTNKDWTEIFVFLSGLINPPDELIQAIYKSNVWLAWWCILEGNSVADETRNYVETRSNGLIYSPVVEDRRAAAEVLAGMKLERSIPPLITLVKDMNEEVSMIARTGLKDLSEIIASEIFNEFYKPGLSDYQRVQLGEALGVTRDIRPGVILSKEHIPVIDWVEVPALSDQTRGSIPAFKMSRYIITNSLFDAFLNDKEGSALASWWTESGKKYRQFPRLLPTHFIDADFTLPNHPAIYVSWFEANAFCAWLSAKLGYVIRLPTEREWMRAAFASLEKNNFEKEYYPYASTTNTLGAGHNKTTPVGSFLNSRSPFGALDMMGNVFCWCQTKWRENLQEAEDNDVEGNFPRVMRGSSFLHTININRMGDFPFGRHHFVGFRVVCCGEKND